MAFKYYVTCDADSAARAEGPGRLAMYDVQAVTAEGKTFNYIRALDEPLSERLTAWYETYRGDDSKVIILRDAAGNMTDVEAQITAKKLGIVEAITVRAAHAAEALLRPRTARRAVPKDQPSF